MLGVDSRYGITLLIPHLHGEDQPLLKETTVFKPHFRHSINHLKLSKDVVIILWVEKLNKQRC